MNNNYLITGLVTASVGTFELIMNKKDYRKIYFTK